MESGVIMASFAVENIIRTRQIAPSVSTALISAAFPENPDILVKNGIPIVEVEYHNLSESGMNEFAMRGVSTGVWTVDDESDMERILNTDISFITTNRPDVLKKCMAKAAACQ
jgi:glycerophosphoryl diester phosphodiesterase